MEQVSRFARYILPHIADILMFACGLLLVVTVLTGCASAPEVRYITTQCEKPKLPLPRLDVEDLTEASSAAQVAQAFQTSLLQCVGHVKQLEELNK